jgi:hypothetical protein
LNTATIAQQQLLRAFPKFTTVALFRDNVADSECEALTMSLQKQGRGRMPLKLPTRNPVAVKSLQLEP